MEKRGALWTTVSPVAAFGYAVVLALSGGIALSRIKLT